MTATYLGGGFRDGSELDRLPEEVAIRAEIAEEQDEQARGRAARAQRVRLEELERDAIRASIVLAQERGELVDHRRAWSDGGIGRTPGEARAFYLAQQEREDAEAELRERREFEQWRRDRQEAVQADVTAPSSDEVAQREAHAAWTRQRQHDDGLVIAARELARMDREAAR